MKNHRLGGSRRLARSASAEPQAGTRVKVMFGRRESTGTIVGKTVTGRYNVTVEVEGADDRVTTSYAPDEVHAL